MHVMIDLETMGTAPGSVIASLGAVAFDPVAGKMGGHFYAVLDLTPQQRAGLTIDGETVKWWLRQGDVAREALCSQAMDPATALAMFTAYWKTEGGACIWGHGANFDEPLLSAAFRAFKLPPPWKFWDARCTRTIYDLAGVKPDRDAGVHHNALDDARAQAEAVIRAYAKLGLQVKAAA